MPNSVTVMHYGVEGTGRTVTEAKKDAGKKIEKALEGSYTPQILAWRGYVALVYRDMQGWQSRLIMDPERGVIDGPVHGSHYGDEIKEAVDAANSNLAQLGWKPEDCLECPSILTTREQQSDFRHWCKFQLRYKAAKSAGLNDNEAHSFAGYNPSTPELQTRVPQEALAAFGVAESKAI
jgi:hypothetical protein